LGGLFYSVEGVRAGDGSGCPLESFCLVSLVGDVSEAFLEPGYFTEPVHLVRFGEPFLGVGFDLQQPW